MTEHHLKCWPAPFQAMWDLLKWHEYRKNDRDYKVGDIIQLHEWEPTAESYSGRILTRVVTYVGTGFGIPDGYVCMTVDVVGYSRAEHSHCVTPCDSIRIQQENHSAYLELKDKYDALHDQRCAEARAADDARCEVVRLQATCDTHAAARDALQRELNDARAEIKRMVGGRQ